MAVAVAAVRLLLPRLAEGPRVPQGCLSRPKRGGETVEADTPLLEVCVDEGGTGIPSPVSGVPLEPGEGGDETAEAGAGQDCFGRHVE
ncbi:hypothetical protein ACIRPU_18870 [Streptomyces sp. NPDC102259]|uniref:hypothetical protein n=1 Tax=Streptomyces sp. NPDC102259 TaxID=3366148 RepID=UPI0037F232D4